jgi:hypothetical protein
MPGTVISSRAGERSGKTWTIRPVSRSPTSAEPSGISVRPVGTASPEATTLGSPSSSPEPGCAGCPGMGACDDGGPTSGGAPSGFGRNGPDGS